MEKKLLYAPWRHEYVNKNNEKNDKKTLKNECVFCHQLELDQDEKCLILKRFKNCFVIMNRYPYNIGHLMVLPNDHIADLRDLAEGVRTEIFNVASISITALEVALKAKGFNVGINMGVAGGGGIPSHMHVHVLPRWIGDTNFLETIGEVKMLSSDVQIVYEMLRNEFSRLVK